MLEFMEGWGERERERVVDPDLVIMKTMLAVRPIMVNASHCAGNSGLT